MCLVPVEARERARSVASGVIDICEPLCGYWELDPGPVEEKPVFLATGPSLQLFSTLCFEITALMESIAHQWAGLAVGSRGLLLSAPLQHQDYRLVSQLLALMQTLGIGTQIPCFHTGMLLTEPSPRPLLLFDNEIFPVYRRPEREGGFQSLGALEQSLVFGSSSDGVIWLLGLHWLAELAPFLFSTGTDGSPLFISCRSKGLFLLLISVLNSPCQCRLKTNRRKRWRKRDPGTDPSAHGSQSLFWLVPSKSLPSPA